MPLALTAYPAKHQILDSEEMPRYGMSTITIMNYAMQLRIKMILPDTNVPE
mgnify:CR=1 FL=1